MGSRLIQNGLIIPMSGILVREHVKEIAEWLNGMINVGLRGSMKKTKSKKAAPQKPKLPKLGDKMFINNTECVIKRVGNGCAWAFPTVDDPDEPMVARHIAFARIDSDGKIVML